MSSEAWAVVSFKEPGKGSDTVRMQQWFRKSILPLHLRVRAVLLHILYHVRRLREWGRMVGVQWFI